MLVPAPCMRTGTSQHISRPRHFHPQITLRFGRQFSTKPRGVPRRPPAHLEAAEPHGVKRNKDDSGCIHAPAEEARGRHVARQQWQHRQQPAQGRGGGAGSGRR